MDFDSNIGTLKDIRKDEASLEGYELLEPCAKPQAQEASRLRATDDACDDGVR